MLFMKRWPSLRLAAVASAVGLLAGCAAAPTAATATATVHVYVDKESAHDLSEVLPGTQYAAHVRPVSVRYEVYQAPTQVDTNTGGIDPVTGMTYPPYSYTPDPTPWTITTMEVIDVWLGNLVAGQTIEVMQYGGYVDGSLLIMDGVPRLLDYIGQDLAILLFRYGDPASVAINPYYICSSLELGVSSMNGSGDTLRLLSADLAPNHQGNGPWDNASVQNSGNGAALTVAQLRKMLDDL